MDKITLAHKRLNEETSWMIGMWTGDNWGSKECSVIRNGKRSCGRFGINNNDIETIERFKKGLQNEFQINKIKIDVQIPRHKEFDKDETKSETSEKFGITKENINVFKGSLWRKHTGYALYTNNTELLRKINNEIYKQLPYLVKNNRINTSAFLQGILDSEGCVDKANKLVTIVNTDSFVIYVIKDALNKLTIQFKTRKDRNKTIIGIKNFKKIRKIGFSIHRKQRLLDELLNGNFAREKDNKYFDVFKDELKNGITARQVSTKFDIPHPTVKLVLKNLTSGGIIKWKKYGKSYVYYLP